MKIAVEGCCHGELDKIYETLGFLEQQNYYKVDLLLICGDFQAVRNKADMQCMAVPSNYMKMNTFYKYYSGEKKAPVLTVFIGGNHEASNYLQALPYGGWVAPNIYYMGYCNVIQFGGIRIGGLSGIFKGTDYMRGHFERPPYDNNTKRSAYHVRNIDVFRLKQITRDLDIFLSHDWPRGVYNYGDVAGLLRAKKYFKDEVNQNKLGSPAAEELLHYLQPQYWFSAHLHVKFAAIVQHESSGSTAKTTKFLSLDKCLPKRKFLQVIDVKARNNDRKLSLDPEWLNILKSTNHLMSIKPTAQYLPGIGCKERYDFSVTDEEMNQIAEDFGGNFILPENFSKTAPVYDPKHPKAKCPKAEVTPDPQTTLLCEMLGLTDPYTVFSGTSPDLSLVVENPDAIPLEDESDDEDAVQDEEDMSVPASSSQSSSASSTNPDEISLEDEESTEESSFIDTTGIYSPDSSLYSSPLRSKLNLPKVSLNMNDSLSSENSEVSSSSDPIRSMKLDDSILAGHLLDDSIDEGIHGVTSTPEKAAKHKGESSELSIQSICDSEEVKSGDGEGKTGEIVKPVPSTQTDCTPPKPKKFKRRNVAIYTNADIGLKRFFKSCNV
ncbi:unnamed protein product [Owenia fusiformis]|uniref:Lariat debranching enzyme C-terminal domain-containing protein n=1 Tax=Owenia fusiformis TaxID=6347 RepID=A0A8S4P9C0_OWEFU|nr:unnamed protein product [Owenia fusiformis]